MKLTPAQHCGRLQPSLYLDDVDPGAIQLGLFAGQNLYTPKRIALAAAQPLDRPRAAWLYPGGVAQSVRADRLHTVELDLGMVEPAALEKADVTA